MRIAGFLLLMGLALAGSGCAWFRKHPAQNAGMAPQPIPVGVVSLVNEGGKFALIDSGNFPSPPVGGVLKCYAGGVESAELSTTQVRKHPFAIADIRSGAPHKGDRVMLQPAVAATPVPVPTATPLPVTR